MSYEGYSQFWCKNGHYWIEDCYFANRDKPCPICGEQVAIEKMVDTTNDEGHPITPKVLKQKKCSHCNSILETIYKIPKKNEYPN